MWFPRRPPLPRAPPLRALDADRRCRASRVDAPPRRADSRVRATMGKRRRRADDDLGAPSAVAQSRAPPPRVPEAPTAAEYARRPADARAPATNPSSRTLAPESDPADDCETPLEAYRHVAPALAKLAQRLKIPKSELRVWDPYYCEGAVARHLSSLGFPNVRNDPVDFYRVVDGDAEPPPHDVLVTNPPFSGDHARRLFTYLAARPPTLPFAVLAPEYVHRKVWYAPVLRTAPDVFYVVPRRRYRYVAARGGRMKNAARTPCRHWVRDGRCPREDACPFAHGDGDGDGDGERAERTGTETETTTFPGMIDRRLSRRSTRCGTCTAGRVATRASSRRCGRNGSAATTETSRARRS